MTRMHRLIAGAMMACAALVAQAQSNTTPPPNQQLQQQEIAKGDPARWYREDSTAAEQARTLRKEIGAALAEANIACKQGPAKEREACLQAARETYRHDLDGVAQVVADKQRK